MYYQERAKRLFTDFNPIVMQKYPYAVSVFWQLPKYRNTKKVKTPLKTIFYKVLLQHSNSKYIAWVSKLRAIRFYEVNPYTTSIQNSCYVRCGIFCAVIPLTFLLSQRERKLIE